MRERVKDPRLFTLAANSESGCFIIAERMGKRQTLGIQNRNKKNFIVFVLLVMLTTQGCTNVPRTSSGNDSETTDSTSASVTDACGPERNVSRPRLIGKVVAVSDGDTATVRDTDSKRHTIRLFAIDAPENGQDFGKVSKSNLSSLIINKSVCVAIIEKDQYRREVGIVYSAGEDINLAQVSAGMAWHYKSHQHQQSATDRWLYSRGEDQARSASRGLWKQAATAIPPWEYRKLKPNRR